jgi:hypothetical protein
MLPLVALMRVWAPYITFPAAVLVGTIGYYVEGMISDRKTPSVVSIDEKRVERKLIELDSQDPKQVSSLKDNRFVSVLDRNLSPSLQKG